MKRQPAGQAFSNDGFGARLPFSLGGLGMLVAVVVESATGAGDVGSTTRGGVGLGTGADLAVGGGVRAEVVVSGFRSEDVGAGSGKESASRRLGPIPNADIASSCMNGAVSA
jgi:hypothetical protein